MALRNIVQEGDEVLRKKTFAVEVFDEKLHQLLEDMKETVEMAEGAGLAAPQIGVLRKIAVVHVEEGYFELINPKIIEAKDEQIGPEACLSVQGKYGIVARPKFVKVEYQDRFGKRQQLTASDFFARAVCHELDHLDGILYVDRATEMRFERKK